jgi:dihydroorotate dehydrogenase
VGNTTRRGDERANARGGGGPCGPMVVRMPAEVVARVGQRLRDARMVTLGPRRLLTTCGKQSSRARS